MVMSVGQKIKKTVMFQSIGGMGAKLGEGMWTIDFQPRHLTN
jgi:hypothetical protein